MEDMWVRCESPLRGQPVPCHADISLRERGESGTLQGQREEEGGDPNLRGGGGGEKGPSLSCQVDREPEI